MHERLKRWWSRTWLVLGLSLVLMQSLGLAHRVMHTQVGVTAAAHVSEVGNVLWGEHHQTSDCQQFDQSCGDVVQHTVAMTAVLSLWPAWQALRGAARSTVFERLYGARAPPVFLL